MLESVESRLVGLRTWVLAFSIDDDQLMRSFLDLVWKLIEVLNGVGP